MELCRKNFEEQNLSLRDEITDLEKEFDELNRGEDARKKQLLELDESIVEEEEKGRMLVSMKEKVIREIASNSIKVEKMEAVVERAVKESGTRRAGNSRPRTETAAKSIAGTKQILGKPDL
ncbi:hypothetical protein R1sor_015182 [Riccia sorocarpa]|uniref:Uncharacterized protein n=1 Tax=Riccia sorocarpa TaxID=122646 RepID=A0ABD3HBV1_9MARC